ncbi:MAG: cyclopropane-fatty-acyl-phospholipid synthase family protein [Pseudomonadota bacterium]
MGPIASRLLNRLIKTGSLVIAEPDGSKTILGDGTGERFEILFHDHRVVGDLLTNPALRFPELYMEGRWSVIEGDLAGLILLAFRNNAPQVASPMRTKIRTAMRRMRQRNTARSARRNATHHYDVGNDIYALFLDEDWQYSCAYFTSPTVTLEEAQLAKKRHIASKLLIENGHKVLDIGCGWGGMGLYLADNLGADVTGITLADEQVRRANQRAGGRPDVRFLVQDYRGVKETFDRIVSVGMFEHVGVNYYDGFFQSCARTLADDGVMLLHSIGRPDGPGFTSPFIGKHIFPGGYIPALSEVLPAIERSGLIVTDIEIWRLHYAETLKAWKERFTAAEEEVVRLRDEQFFRMWQIYLASCEASFRAGDMMVFQIQLAKSLSTVPLTRDYMTRTEQSLAARDTAQAVRPALVARRG